MTKDDYFPWYLRFETIPHSGVTKDSLLILKEDIGFLRSSSLPHTLEETKRH